MVEGGGSCWEMFNNVEIIEEIFWKIGFCLLNNNNNNIFNFFIVLVFLK